MVECGTCNPKVMDSSPALSQVPSFTCSKNCGPRQGRVRQLALRASLESVSGSDHERVAWPLYKHEVPLVCIPRATGDKGMKRMSPQTLGTRDRAKTCHKQEKGAFSPVSPSISLGSFTFYHIGCFNYPLGEVLWKDANLQHGIFSFLMSY